MLPTDLTTVGAVQGFIGTPAGVPAPDPTALQQIISGASLMALQQMDRNILGQTYTADRYDGRGTDRLMLAQWPIISVSQVQMFTGQINPLTIPPSPNSLGYGYVIDRNLEVLDLIGGIWTPGRQNIAVTYVAGYPDSIVTNEPVNVPATTPYTGLLLGGSNLRAMTSLVYASGGAPLVKVASTPAAGQYTLSALGALGFAAADAGAALLASYTTNGTPADLNLAICEWVAFTFAKRSRMDKKSELLAQQSIGYDMSAMPSQTQMTLSNYTRPFAV